MIVSFKVTPFSLVSVGILLGWFVVFGGGEVSNKKIGDPQKTSRGTSGLASVTGLLL